MEEEDADARSWMSVKADYDDEDGGEARMSFAKARLCSVLSVVVVVVVMRCALEPSRLSTTYGDEARRRQRSARRGREVRCAAASVQPEYRFRIPLAFENG